MSRVALDRALVLFRDLGRYDLAEQELRRALELDPEDAGAHYLLSLTLGNQQRGTEGLVHARRAIELAPEWYCGFHALAWNHYVGNRLAQADEALREALRLGPEAIECWRLLACLEMGRRRWREALGAVDQMLGLDPEHAEGLRLRAVILAETGQARAALATSARGLAQAPLDAELHAAHGRNLLDAHQAGLAFEHYREALRLDPNSEQARQGALTALKARLPLGTWILTLVRRLQDPNSNVRIWLFVGLLPLFIAMTWPAMGVGALLVGPILMGGVISQLFLAGVLLRGIVNIVVSCHPFARRAMPLSEKLFAIGTGLFVFTIAMIVLLIVLESTGFNDVWTSSILGATWLCCFCMVPLIIVLPADWRRRVALAVLPCLIVGVSYLLHDETIRSSIRSLGVFATIAARPVGQLLVFVIAILILFTRSRRSGHSK